MDRTTSKVPAIFQNAVWATKGKCSLLTKNGPHSFTFYVLRSFVKSTEKKCLCQGKTIFPGRQAKLMPVYIPWNSLHLLATYLWLADSFGGLDLCAQEVSRDCFDTLLLNTFNGRGIVYHASSNERHDCLNSQTSCELHDRFSCNRLLGLSCLISLRFSSTKDC